MKNVLGRKPDAPAETGGQESDRMYTLVRMSESQRLRNSRMIFTAGIGMLLFSMFVLLAAGVLIYSVIPYFDQKEYVIFEVEKSTGIVHVVQSIDQPFNPDERVREFFITQVINDLESYSRSRVNDGLNRVRHYFGETGKRIFEEHYARMQKLFETMGSRRKLVRVESVHPLTTHGSGQTVNQSTADVVVEVDLENSGTEKRYLTVILGYRFVPYTKAEKESANLETIEKIRKNPLGMEVLEYEFERKLPTHRAQQ